MTGSATDNPGGPNAGESVDEAIAAMIARTAPFFAGEEG